MIDTAHALRILEAVLFASETPVSILVLRQAFEDEYDTQPDQKITNAQIESWLNQLSAKLIDSALELTKTASGYRIQVRPEYARIVNRLWPERPIRLSQALLETLSVIAYRQPVTRADIEQLRGVTVNSQILRTLFDRQWIAEDGFRPVAGRPALLVTTKHFLDAFGLQSLEQLPELQEMNDIIHDLSEKKSE
ncbi:MAG: SMC-Scp complex subunit ScpB [Gammaproteobacteria bacterium]|nr:SMC-Scp complex subunit ScpB [Gammaproteobacteria bacterium]